MMRRLLTVSLLGIFAGAAQAQMPGPFTAAQANAGRDAYLASCAPCHGKTLQGGGEAPALTGDAFIGSWGKRAAEALTPVAALALADSAGEAVAEQVQALHARVARAGINL